MLIGASYQYCFLSFELLISLEDVRNDHTKEVSDMGS